MITDFKNCNVCKAKPGTCINCNDNPLKSGKQGKMNMKDLDEAFKASFGSCEREILDEAEYWKQVSIEEKKKKEHLTLTESEKAEFDSATITEAKTINHGLDAAFDKAFK